MEKFKEVGLFLLCVIIILAAGYFTGFLKGFTPDDFQDAYNRIATQISNGIKSTGISSTLSSESTTGSQNTTIFKNYKAIPIPEKVLKGYATSNAWSNIFGAPQKVIFYIYDDDKRGANPKFSPEYHTQLNSYIEANKMTQYYSYVPVTLYYFEKLNWGGTGPDKMCNSIQECNEYREKASNYSLMSDFLKQCGKSMCIINPRNKQYVMLKRRDASDAINMMNAIKTW